MEKFQELRDEAEKKLHLADHMLTMTYPMIKDPKLLLSAIESLFLAFSYGMSSVLYYERLFKRIPLFPDDFRSKFEVFKDRCSERYNLDKEYLKIMQELKEIIVAHKKSPMEFPRNDAFVICSADYRTKVIFPNMIKIYVEKAKLFIKRVSAIVSKDEAIFNR